MNGRITPESRIRRAWEPPEDVVVSRDVAFCADLQPEDYGVLIRLLLRDPGLSSTMKELVAEFQASGWKMGESRFSGVFKRLKKAGHVRHVAEFNAATGRPQWVVEVYRNPANNQQHNKSGGLASVQVRAGTVISTEAARSSLAGSVETADSSGQRETAISTDLAAKPWISGSRNSTVSTGQERNRDFHPPAFSPPTTPQGEVDTSSPNPLTSSAVEGEEGRSAAPALDASAILAAGEFLASLPGSWACGRKTMRELAPLLAETAAAQGWRLDDDLMAELTKNPGGIHSFRATLKSRIEDLRRHPGGMQAHNSTRSAERCPHHPGRPADDCLPCRSLPLDEPGTASDADTAGPDAAQVAEAARDQLRRGVIGAQPGARSGRRRARTETGRAATQRWADVEFEKRRAEALRRLEEFDTGHLGDVQGRGER